MVQIDHEAMSVARGAMAVRMTMGLRPFPALVFVLVVRVVHMQVLMIHRVMNVVQLDRVV